MRNLPRLCRAGRVQQRYDSALHLQTEPGRVARGVCPRGCGPANASNTSVPQKLADIAGSGATDCGQVAQLAGEQVQKASDCAMSSAKAKKPFRVEYDMPGLAVGIAGNSAGKLFAVQSEVDNGKASEAKVTDCPAELRVAQSGRVTCMPPGNMGVAPGSANPHATSGANPHGGMPMPAAGTLNPHGSTTAPQKSH